MSQSQYTHVPSESVLVMQILALVVVPDENKEAVAKLGAQLVDQCVAARLGQLPEVDQSAPEDAPIGETPEVDQSAHGPYEVIDASKADPEWLAKRARKLASRARKAAAKEARIAEHRSRTCTCKPTHKCVAVRRHGEKARRFPKS